jgi:CubicO group peptidase (beta-lactamase class C family)
MQQLLFGPAHMTDSGRLTNSVVPPQRVQGYDLQGDPERLGNYNNYYIPYSSIRDLERMDRALLSGHLLSKHALHALFTPRISGDAVNQRYLGSNAIDLAGGYECYLRHSTRTTVTVVDHPGDLGGMAMDDAISPDDGSIAIVAKNDEAASPSPTDLLFGLAPHLLWGK